MIQLKKAGFLMATAVTLFACKKDVDPIIIFAPSSGSQVQLNGLTGAELPGAAPGNSVFVDFSADKQTLVERKSWDLGFYGGAEFRVILNNTTSATAKALSKTDLTQVNGTDTVGLNGLSLGLDAASKGLVDDVHGDLNKTVIAAVSENEANNKVYIINPGTGGGAPAKDWYKIRMLRNANGGYKLQYAKLAAATFNTMDIAKDANYNFRYVSFEAGQVEAEPAKANWDIKWSYEMYETPLDQNTIIPYASADFVSINAKGGATAAEVVINTITFENFTKAAASGLTFSNKTDAIGTKWRSVANPNVPNSTSGVKKDRFYVVKDPAGNIYKLKF